MAEQELKHLLVERRLKKGQLRKHINTLDSMMKAVQEESSKLKLEDLDPLFAKNIMITSKMNNIRTMDKHITTLITDEDQLVKAKFEADEYETQVEESRLINSIVLQRLQEKAKPEVKQPATQAAKVTVTTTPQQAANVTVTATPQTAVPLPQGINNDPDFKSRKWNTLTKPAAQTQRPSQTSQFDKVKSNQVNMTLTPNHGPILQFETNESKITTKSGTLDKLLDKGAQHTLITERTEQVAQLLNVHVENEAEIKHPCLGTFEKEHTGLQALKSVRVELKRNCTEVLTCLTDVDRGPQMVSRFWDLEKLKGVVRNEDKTKKDENLKEPIFGEYRDSKPEKLAKGFIDKMKPPDLLNCDCIPHHSITEWISPHPLEPGTTVVKSKEYISAICEQGETFRKRD